MSFIILNCQVVEWIDIFANPVFKNPGIYSTKKSCLFNYNLPLSFRIKTVYNEPLVLHRVRYCMYLTKTKILSMQDTGYFLKITKINSQQEKYRVPYGTILSFRSLCHSIYIGSNKYIFVPLHDIFMPNKTYSYHCIILFLCLYSFKNIYAYCACWSAELIRECDAEE